MTVEGTRRLPPLTSKALHRAALLARLSGLCYYPAEQLAERLANEGMKLVVSGNTSFTRLLNLFSSVLLLFASEQHMKGDAHSATQLVRRGRAL